MERHQAASVPHSLLNSNVNNKNNNNNNNNINHQNHINDAVDVTLLSTHQNTIHALTATTPSSLETTQEIHQLVHTMRDVLLFARLYTAAVRREPRILHLLLRDAEVSCVVGAKASSGCMEREESTEDEILKTGNSIGVNNSGSSGNGAKVSGRRANSQHASNGVDMKVGQHSRSAPRTSSSSSSSAGVGILHLGSGRGSLLVSSVVEVKSRHEMLREQGISAVRAVLRAFIIDQRVLLRRCEETTTATAASSSSSHSSSSVIIPETFFQSSFAARQLYEDMQTLSQSLLIPLDLLRYRQEWLLIHEDMRITLKDVMLHSRAAALRMRRAHSHTGKEEEGIDQRKRIDEEEKEKDDVVDVSRYALSIWSDLTSVLAAAVRQRHRIFGVDGPHTRILVIGDDTRSSSSPSPSPSSSSPSASGAGVSPPVSAATTNTRTTTQSIGPRRVSNGEHDWARISFGPLAPHSIAHTTSQRFAIRRPLLPMLLHSLRVRQASSTRPSLEYDGRTKNSSTSSNATATSLPFFDACVDSEAYAVPYLSPQSYTALQASGRRKETHTNKEKNVEEAEKEKDEWQTLTLADDVWSVAVITLEMMLSSFDFNSLPMPSRRRRRGEIGVHHLEKGKEATIEEDANRSPEPEAEPAQAHFSANASDSFFASLCAWRRWCGQMEGNHRNIKHTGVNNNNNNNNSKATTTSIGVISESDARFLYSVLHALQEEYCEHSSTISRRRRREETKKVEVEAVEEDDYDDDERKHFFPAQSDAEENYRRDGSGPSSKDSLSDGYGAAQKRKGEGEEVEPPLTASASVARVLLHFLRKTYPSSDAMHGVMSIGLLWRREDRYRAFFTEQGMGEWYAEEMGKNPSKSTSDQHQGKHKDNTSRDGVGVDGAGQLSQRKLQAALAALQTPLLPLLGNLTPSIPQDTAMRDLIDLLAVTEDGASESIPPVKGGGGGGDEMETEAEQRARAGSVVLVKARDGNTGGGGSLPPSASGGLGGPVGVHNDLRRSSATTTTTTAIGSGGITSFLYTFREWRRLIERVMLLEGGGGGSGGSEAKSRAVFSEMVNLVQRVAQSSAAAAAGNDSGRGESKSSSAPPSTGSATSIGAASGSSGTRLINRRIPRASVPPAAAVPPSPPQHNREILIVPMLRELFGRQLLCSIRTHCQPHTASSSAAASLLFSSSLSGNHTIPHATFELPQVVAVLRADILYFTRHLAATNTSMSVSSTSAHPRALDSLVGGPVQSARRLQATRGAATTQVSSAAEKDRRRWSVNGAGGAASQKHASAFPPDYEARLQLSREIRKPLGVIRALDLNGEAQQQLVMRLRKLFVILNARCGAASASSQGSLFPSAATIVREFMWTVAVEELQLRRLRNRSQRRTTGGGGGGSGRRGGSQIPRQRRMRRDVISACATAAIPDTLRGLVWEQLLQLPDRYTREQVLMKSVDPSQRLNCDRQIAVDIPRCHQYSPLFSSVEGHAKLKRVIKTWLLLHPRLTYWQGLDSVCASLLAASYHDEALAVAQMSALTTFFIPHYYCSQTQSRADSPDSPAPPSAFESPVFPRFHPVQSSTSAVVYPQQGRMEDRLRHFMMVLTYCDPQLAHHLFVEVECRPELFAISWFLTLFAHNLPLKKVHLVWNTLFYLSSFSVEGSNCRTASGGDASSSSGMRLPIVSASPASVMVCVACAVVMQKRAALLSGDLVACLTTLSCIHDINAVRLPHTTAKLLVSLPESILAPPFLTSSNRSAEGASPTGISYTGDRNSTRDSIISGIPFYFSLFTSPVALLLPSDLLRAYVSVHAVPGTNTNISLLTSTSSSSTSSTQESIHHDDFDWTAQGVCVVDLRADEERHTTVPGQTTHILSALVASTLIAPTTSLDMQEVEELIHTIRHNPCGYSIPPARLLRAVHFRGGRGGRGGGGRRNRNKTASGRCDEDGVDDADGPQGMRASKTRLMTGNEVESPLLFSGSEDASGSMFELSSALPQHARSSIASSAGDRGVIGGKRTTGAPLRALTGISSAAVSLGGGRGIPHRNSSAGDITRTAEDEYDDDERYQEEEEEGEYDEADEDGDEEEDDLRLVTEMHDYNPLTVKPTTATTTTKGITTSHSANNNSNKNINNTTSNSNSSGITPANVGTGSGGGVAVGVDGSNAIGGGGSIVGSTSTDPAATHNRSSHDDAELQLPWAPHVVLIIPGATVQQKMGSRRFEERVTRLCETFIAAGLPKVSLLTGGFAALQELAPQLIVKVDD